VVVHCLADHATPPCFIIVSSRFIVIVVIAGLRRVTSLVFGFISVSAEDSSSQTENVSSHHLPRAHSTIAAAAAAIQRRHIVRIRVRSTPGPLSISMADYFPVSRAFLPHRGRQTERATLAPHTCTYRARIKLISSLPDEIRRTGHEFVIQGKGSLYHWEPIDVSIIFFATRIATWYYTNESSNSTSCKAFSIVLSSIGVYNSHLWYLFSINPSIKL